MLPPPEKIFLKLKKDLNKKIAGTSRYSICTCQACGKPTFSCLVKNKKMSNA
jgi:hypothetical protein